MRWLPFFILAYLALGVQSGLGAYAQVGEARPNLVLLAAVFVAVNAPRDAALLGCVLMGLMLDLLTNSPLGLWGLALGVVGWVVVNSRDIVYRDHFLTHFWLGLSSALVSGAVIWLHSWVYPRLHPQMHMPRPTLAALAAGALYTALLAPVVLGLLQRMQTIFAFRGGRKGLAKRD
jgi:rod shape-determining protein MreD